MALVFACRVFWTFPADGWPSVDELPLDIQYVLCCCLVPGGIVLQSVAVPFSRVYLLCLALRSRKANSTSVY